MYDDRNHNNGYLGQVNMFVEEGYSMKSGMWEASGLRKCLLCLPGWYILYMCIPI